MKESLGGVQLFALVVVLVIIFAGIVTLTINHANAFTVKDKLIYSIEKNGGFGDAFGAELVSGRGNAILEEMVKELQENSYRQTGKCPEEGDNSTVIGYLRDGRIATSDQKASFCIVRTEGRGAAGAVPIYYYKIIVFYHLDLPIFNELYDFKAVGESKALYK